MICLGCYTETKESYCLKCRKKLFNKQRVRSVLDFDAPKADNLEIYQEHSKRLSISGVQLKYSLRLKDNKLVLSETQGQYILKPIPPSRQLINIDDLPENEHLTMQIAEQIFGINTAANGLIQFKDQLPAYLTKRFDVMEDGKKYMQEDFAQLTNRTRKTHGETFKYDGTYTEIGILIKKFVAASMPALEKFFQLIVFNYIISNGDAHLKNFSLIRNKQGEYQLAPAYNLVSTVMHTPHEADTALDIYENDIDSEYYKTHGHYGRENFIDLSRILGIVEKRAQRIIDSFADKENIIAQFVNRSFLSQEGKQLYMHYFLEKQRRLNK